MVQLLADLPWTSAVPVLPYTPAWPLNTPASVPLVTTACISVLRFEQVDAGSAVAESCDAPGTRIGCLNEQFAMVAATEAMASGEVVIWSWPTSSSARLLDDVFGTVPYVVGTPRPTSH